MAAEFTENLTEFLEDKLKEFNPNIAVGEGTAVRDLFIKPLSVVFQPMVDEIIRTRENLSLADADQLEDIDLDRLAANFFVTRKLGAKATGSARLFFNEPVDEFIVQGTVLVAGNGVRFVTTEDVTITSSGLRLNTFGELFFFDANAEAETAGVDGNIPADLISDILIGTDKIVDITNPIEFIGGADTESNEDLIARLNIAITFRNLINDNGAKLILLENFDRLLDVFVVGFAKTHAIEQEIPSGIVDGINTVFQLLETEDVIDVSIEVFNEVGDETVLTGGGVVAGFKPLDFFPYDKTTLKLAAGASFAAGLALVAGTDFVAGQKVSIADETAAAGPVGAGPVVLSAVDFFPVDTLPAIEVRAGADITSGVLLTTPTDYTIVPATGVITLTIAGALVVDAQVPPDVHVKYSATSPNAFDFALLPAGAAAINGEAPPDLHAQYDSGPLDAALASGDFFGLVTLVVPPSVGSVLKVDYEYHLQKRDLLSGDNLVLGDDTFGTVSNVHIGGKVDYYLKFLGLEEKEVRINGLKSTNFLFPQGPTDPAPLVTEQYITVVSLPLISLKNIELVDTGTNLPSGVFLSSVNVQDETVEAGPVVAGIKTLTNFPYNFATLELRAGPNFLAGVPLVSGVDYDLAGADTQIGEFNLTAAGAILVNAEATPDIHARYVHGDFELVILANKLNLNMSTKQKLKLVIFNTTRLAEDIFFRYFTHQDFPLVQAFIDDPVNRIVTADLLARAPMPVFVDLTINYSRATGGPDPAAVEAAVINFIDTLKLGECLSSFDLATALAEADVKFVQLPITLNAERVNLDFSTVQLTSENKIEIPPNFQFVARDITINEVPLSSCDSI